MTTTVHARLADPLGVYLTTIPNYVQLHYVLRADPEGIGVCELTVPPGFDLTLFKVDGRIGIWRSINGRPPALDGDAIYLIRRMQFNPDNTTTVTAWHSKSLLQRRILAYYAGSSYTDKPATVADNLLKIFWNQNMGSGIVDADRIGAETQANVLAYLGLQANLSAAPAIAKACAWRNLFDVAVELCEASAVAGTYLTFDVVAPAEGTLELRTYTGQRGVDRRAGSGQAVILSPARGNLENVTIVEDYSQETTFAIAAGQGEKETRLTATASDAARMAVSPFGRIERFVDMSNVDDATQLQDEADAALWYGRPTITFSGDLVETPGTTRGIHFDLGDIVTAEAHGRQYDMRIDLVDVTVQGGDQKSSIALRSVT